MYAHTPILLDETLEWLSPQAGGRFVDATVGFGGHTRALLDRTAPDGCVLGIDQDQSSMDAVKQMLASYGSRLVLVQANFRSIASLAKENGFWDADGVLADIGVSSMMLDDPARGFSFMREGPLDMRMDRSQKLTAYEIVNFYSEKEIANILYI